MNAIKKRFALVCLILSMAWSANAQQVGWVSMKGRLKGFNNQVNIEDMSEFQYLLPQTSDRLIVPDSTGNFSIKFKIKAPNYYRLGRNQLYLTPGDQLEVFIDYADPKNATFKGTSAAANIYLKNTPFPKGGSFIEAGKNVKETPEATILTLEELAKLRQKELAETTGITTEFRRLEAARINADLINSLKSGEFYSVYKLKLKDENAKVFTETYKTLIAPKVKFYSQNFTDPSLLKMTVYRDIADEVIKEGGKPAAIQTIKDYYTASLLVEEMQKVSDKQLLASFKTKIAQLKTINYQTAVGQMLTHLIAFGKGDVAVDFTAINTKGEKVNLSSLKGKVIYVDLWATWCGPCMQEMPNYEKLKAKYTQNPAVVFVSLSIDDNDVLWKGNVEQRKAEGYQWIINRAKLQPYHIVGIPRSLLIDQNFKMVDMAAPLPSSSAAIKAIDALLK